MKKIINKLPDDVEKRLQNTHSEVADIIKEAVSVQKTQLTGNISFTFANSAPTDLLTPFERAQSICFVTRYEHLPTLETIPVFKQNGKFFLKNIKYVRHILNEYRSIVMNQRDSIYYAKIHKFCDGKLKNRDHKKGLSITVNHENDGDVTESFIEILGERNKSIKTILRRCEFDYIYNGILQHSDDRFTERFLDEYHSGKINHIFLKHAFLLREVKDFLFWHYKILNSLSFPKLGPI